MSYHDKPFTPDEVDEQLEHIQYHTADTSSQPNTRLVQHLQLLYRMSDQADTRSVEHIWERLTQESKNIHLQPDTLPPLMPVQREKRSSATGKTFSAQRQFIKSIAAVLIVASMVGSLALVLNTIHRSRQEATSTNLSPVPGVYTAFETTVSKFDARTGASSWQYNSGANWMDTFYATPPTVVGDSVYALSHNSLYVVNARTGKLRWKQQWAGNSMTDLNVFPLVRGNVVLVSTVNGVSSGYATPGSRPTPTATDDSGLHALDTTTGKELWSKPLPSGQPVKCVSCIPATNTTLYILSNSALYAINLVDGSQSWSRPVTGLAADVIVASGRVYLSNDTSGTLHAFDAQNGNLLWTTSLEQGYQIDHLQTNGSIVYLTAIPNVKGKDYYEAAYDAQTGALLWKFPVAAIIKSKPLLNQNMLYISAQNGYVYALDVHSGKKLWSYHADGDFQLSTVDNTIFYLGVGDAHTKENEHAMADAEQLFTLHYIVALSKEGTELQRYTVANNLSPQMLVVGNGIIYLLAFPDSASFAPFNVFVALSTRDGKQIWQQKVIYHSGLEAMVEP